MGTIVIPGGEPAKTHDPGVSEKTPRQLSGLADRPTMKASPVFTVSEGGGDNGGTASRGAAGGYGDTGGSSNPANDTGTGVW